MKEIMNNTEKTMDKIVALCKHRDLSTPGPKFTEGLQTPGTTARLAWSSRTM